MQNIKPYIIGGVVGVGITLIGSYSISKVEAYTGYLGLTNKSISEEEKVQKIQEYIDTFYVDPYEKDDLVENMYAGYVAGLDDPYSTYLTRESYTKFIESASGEYAGIGAVVSVDELDNKVVVVSPFKGSPAEKAGLEPGDKILKVNDTDVYGDALEEATSILKGKAGTEVNVTVLKKISGETVELTITRDNIVMESVDYKMLDDNIGYISLSGFESNTDDQFNEAYEEILNNNAQGLIIDVRNNPGGLLNVVENIADKLVPEGTIVYTEDKDGNKSYAKSDPEEIEIPLVILINGNSASASEVLSGAVQDWDKGILVGEQSFGKGLVQRVFQLPDGSAVKLTVAKYYTPSGVCIQGVGLTPDVYVEMDDELTARVATLTYEEDVQLQKAVEVIKEQASK